MYKENLHTKVRKGPLRRRESFMQKEIIKVTNLKTPRLPFLIACSKTTTTSRG